MKRVTPATEDRLMAAVTATVDGVSEGLSPTEAVIRAAKEASLRPGEVELVARAYNTGQTNQLRQRTDDLPGKVAEFALADGAEARRAVFPDTVKTAAEQTISEAISPEYSYSPAAMLQRRARLQALPEVPQWSKVAASGYSRTGAKPKADDGSRVLATIRRSRRQAEEARRKLSVLRDKLASQVVELSEYFREPGALSIPVVQEAAWLLHGDKATRLIDEVVRLTPTAKRAQATAGPEGPDVTQRPFPLIADILTLADTCRQAAADYREAASRGGQQVKEAVSPVCRPLVSPSLLEAADPGLEKLAVGNRPLQMVGAYSLLNTAVTPIIDQVQKDKEKTTQKTLAKLDDPQHEQALQAANAQAVLQDFILNDPVISGFDPDEVTEAYNELTQLAPTIAQQQMLLRTMLRKRLQQGTLDNFEQEQLLKTDVLLRERQDHLGQTSRVANPGSGKGQP